ncbi:MAG: hypothetical protein ACKPE6_08715, partial [Gammaproteobacteria bacterium]
RVAVLGRVSTRLAAAALIALGVFMIAFGGWWSPWFLRVLETLPGGAWLELVLPFLPMVIIGFGAAMLTRNA